MYLHFYNLKGFISNVQYGEVESSSFYVSTPYEILFSYFGG